MKRFALQDEETAKINTWIREHRKEIHNGDNISCNYVFDDNGFVYVECKECKERGLL